MFTNDYRCRKIQYNTSACRLVTIVKQASDIELIRYV